MSAASGNGSFAISWGLDSTIKTPYSHLIDFSIARELRDGSSLEISYVGRLAHRQLAQEDVAMPINLQAGGTSYFTPAAQLSKMARANVAVSSVAPDPYWEQVFGGLDGQDIGLGYGPMSATQNVYALFLSIQRDLCALSVGYTGIVAEQQHWRRGELSGVSVLLRPVFRFVCVAICRLCELQRTRGCLPGNASAQVCRQISITPIRSRWTSPRRRSGWEVREASTMRRS
ncbi:MAG: hypothetical protein QOJ51_2215 [Acidobacteriaceae bacterium]|nr:hypothetical protein [Acidobacteriaceae bacterium]